MSLSPYRRVRSGYGPAHDVDVPVMLKCDFGDALAVRPGRGHLLLGGTGLTPKRPEHGLEQGGLAGAIGPVHADEPGRQRQLQLFLEDPVIAKIYLVDQQGCCGSRLARGLDRFFDVMAAQSPHPFAVEAGQVLVGQP